MLKLHRERVLLVEQPDGRNLLKTALQHGGLKYTSPTTAKAL